MLEALVVDNEGEICDFLKEQLEEMNMTVRACLTGEEALQVIDSGRRIHLAVVDLKLSTRTTGLEVLEFFKRKFPGSPAVAITGYIDMGIEQEVKRMGADDYLLKPDGIQPAVFLSHIRKLLAKAGFFDKNREKTA